MNRTIRPRSRIIRRASACSNAEIRGYRNAARSRYTPVDASSVPMVGTA